MDLKRHKMLTVNAEYQRGAVWNLREKQLLIDSIFRGYPVPMIFLHKKKLQSAAGYSRDDFDVIDGQQRLNALYEFVEGAFFLLDPLSKAQIGRLPAFARSKDCPWAGKRFSELTNDFQQSLVETKISVSMIETDEDNEVRDLFIRLQGGQPLNHQETRDAWPGSFTDFILRIGGKPDILRYHGHTFFQKTLGMKPKSDRGKTRMLAAQLAMLFVEQRKNGAWRLPDISNQALNEHYYDNLDFDPTSEVAVQFVEVLNTLEKIFEGQNLPKLRAHDAMHAMMLVDELRRDYAPGWKNNFAEALSKFLERLTIAKKRNETGEFDEYWMEYGQWTRTNSDRGDNIARRHKFYVSRMVRNLGDLKPLDSMRTYGDMLRRVLFFEQDKTCAVCLREVHFDDMEVHHVTPHASGGKTSVENGAIVHKECHPKSQQAVAEFGERWRERKKNLDSRRKGISISDKIVPDMNAGADFVQDGVVIPHGTPARMEYLNGNQVYEGRFEDGVLLVNGCAYSSLPSAANALAVTKDGRKTSLNGWLYWKAMLPGTSYWISLKEIRDRIEAET